LEDVDARGQEVAANTFESEVIREKIEQHHKERIQFK